MKRSVNGLGLYLREDSILAALGRGVDVVDAPADPHHGPRGTVACRRLGEAKVGVHHRLGIERSIATRHLAEPRDHLGGYVPQIAVGRTHSFMCRRLYRLGRA